MRGLALKAIDRFENIQQLQQALTTGEVQNIIECPECGAKNQLNPGDDPNALRCGKCKSKLWLNPIVDKPAPGSAIDLGGYRYIPLKEAEGKAFCLGCRSVDSMNRLYYCHQNGTYYHKECLIKKGGISSPGKMSEIENNLGGQDYHYSKDLTSLTKFLKGMLWISLGLSVIALLSDFMQMNLLSAGSFSQAEADANDIRQRFIAVLQIVAFLVTGIAFLKWIHRANSNCHGFGAQGMKFSPGWSIGYYFIPILLLYRPYQAMKEIWKVSTSPTNWQNEMGGPLLGWWWALWLIAGFLGQASFKMSMKANTVSSLQDSTAMSIALGIIDIPLYIVAVSLVSAIFSKQENLVRRKV